MRTSTRRSQTDGRRDILRNITAREGATIGGWQKNGRQERLEKEWTEYEKGGEKEGGPVCKTAPRSDSSAPAE